MLRIPLKTIKRAALITLVLVVMTLFFYAILRRVPDDLAFLQVFVILITLLTGIVATFLALAPDIAPLYGKSRRDTMDIMLRTLLRYHGLHTIEDGHTTIPAGVAEASLSGPRTIRIRSSAIVLHKGPELKSIRGPGMVDTASGEYVRYIFDLRPTQEALTYEDVLSADHIPTRIALSVTYGIDVLSDTVDARKKMTPAEEKRILRIYHEMPDWEKVVKEDIEQSLRKVVAHYPFNDLLKPAAIDALSHEVRTRSRRRLHPSGIRLRRVLVLSIQPDEELLQAANRVRISSAAELAKTSNELLQVANRARVDNQIELDKARVYRDTLRLIAEAYANAQQRGMSDADMQREVLRRILEVLVHHDQYTSYPLTADVVQALLALRRHVGL
jgi:hypothetical protein